MNLNENPGKILFRITIAAAALFAAPIALTFIFGFVFAGLGGVTGFFEYSKLALTGFLATLFVVVGFFGSSSNKKVYPIFIIIGTSLLLLILTPLLRRPAWGLLQFGIFLVLLVEFLALVLSSLRLTQTSSMR